MKDSISINISCDNFSLYKLFQGMNTYVDIEKKNISVYQAKSDKIWAYVVTETLSAEHEFFLKSFFHSFSTRLHRCDFKDINFSMAPLWCFGIESFVKENSFCDKIEEVKIDRFFIKEYSQNWFFFQDVGFIMHSPEYKKYLWNYITGDICT